MLKQSRTLLEELRRAQRSSQYLAVRTQHQPSVTSHSIFTAPAAMPAGTARAYAPCRGG